MDRLILNKGEEIGYIVFRKNSIFFNITKDCDIEEYEELVKEVEENYIHKTKHTLTLGLLDRNIIAIEEQGLSDDMEFESDKLTKNI